MEMFSECILMLVMYHLVCFTPFVPDFEVRFRLGYMVCGLVCLHLAVSIVLMLKDKPRELRLKYQLRNAKKAHKAQRQELQDRLEERAPSRLEKRKA